MSILVPLMIILTLQFVPVAGKRKTFCIRVAITEQSDTEITIQLKIAFTFAVNITALEFTYQTATTNVIAMIPIGLKQSSTSTRTTI